MNDEATLTNTCDCEVWDEVTDTYSQSPACYGCWDDDLEQACYLINNWLELSNISDDYDAVKINGSGLTWQRLDGYKLTDGNANDILEALQIRGDYTISLTLENGKLTATRYSHDEPTGASFTITRND